MRILYIILIFVFFGDHAQAQKLPFTNHTELGLLAGNGIKPSFSIQTFNGVKIQKWQLEAGISTGLDIYSPVIVLPLSGSLAWNPLNSRTVSPIIGLNAGYGFGWLESGNENAETTGGYMINPSIGLRIKTKDTAKLNIGIGFREQRAVTQHTSNFYLNDFTGGRPGIETKDEYRFRRISLTLGLSL